MQRTKNTPHRCEPALFVLVRKNPKLQVVKEKNSIFIYTLKKTVRTWFMYVFEWVNFFCAYTNYKNSLLIQEQSGSFYFSFSFFSY